MVTKQLCCANIAVMELMMAKGLCHSCLSSAVEVQLVHGVSLCQNCFQRRGKEIEERLEKNDG